MYLAIVLATYGENLTYPQADSIRQNIAGKLQRNEVFINFVDDRPIAERLGIQQGDVHFDFLACAVMACAIFISVHIALTTTIRLFDLWRLLTVLSNN